MDKKVYGWDTNDLVEQLTIELEAKQELINDLKEQLNCLEDENLALAGALDISAAVKDLYFRAG